MQVVPNNRKASVSIDYDNYLPNKTVVVDDEFWNKHTNNKFFKYKNSQIFGGINKSINTIDVNCYTNNNNNNNNAYNREDELLNNNSKEEIQTDRLNFNAVKIPRIGRSISKNKEKSLMRDVLSYSYYEEKPSRSNSKVKEVTGKITNAGTEKW